MIVRGRPRFDPELRARRQELFTLERTTGGGTVELTLGGRPLRVYRNANFSIYSGQRCNARCPFCVEELRPASRGTTLDAQRTALASDALYFERLERALEAVRPVDPSVSITGGEASLDPRLPGILDRVARAGARKRTLTTNGSGLLRRLDDGRLVARALVDAGLEHLNVSRASPDETVNDRIMRIGSGARTNDELREVIELVQAGGVQVRLSCVLLRGVTETAGDLARYLEWARSLGVRRVIFRQLMEHDPERVLEGPVTRYSDERRVDLGALLDALHPSEDGGDPRFALEQQILGYYYYVEVYAYRSTSGGEPMACVFERADLAWIRLARERAAARGEPEVVHELVFHPGGTLNSTWQPRDGVLLG